MQCGHADPVFQLNPPTSANEAIELLCSLEQVTAPRLLDLEQQGRTVLAVGGTVVNTYSITLLWAWLHLSSHTEGAASDQQEPAWRPLADIAKQLCPDECAQLEKNHWQGLVQPDGHLSEVDKQQHAASSLINPSRYAWPW